MSVGQSRARFVPDAGELARLRAQSAVDLVVTTQEAGIPLPISDGHDQFGRVGVALARNTAVALHIMKVTPAEGVTISVLVSATANMASPTEVGRLGITQVGEFMISLDRLLIDTVGANYVAVKATLGASSVLNYFAELQPVGRCY